MLVESVMSRDVRTLAPDASPAEAIHLMDQHRIRHLPIVEDGRLVGVVSDRDLLAATGWLTESVTEKLPHDLRAILHAPVKTLDPQDQLVTASLQLILHGIGCMPVVDGDELVGIVTDADLLRAFLAAARDRKLSGECDPAISKLMTRGATTITPLTTLKEARATMKDLRVHHLPVVDGERLVGLLSDRDLRWAEGRHLDPDAAAEVFMSDFVVSVAPHQSVSAAARQLVEHHFSALPVVDEERLVGIVTSTDLLDHCLQTLWEPDGIPPRHG